MALTEALTLAFLVGRDQYLTTPLAYQGLLDPDTNTFRLQVAPAGSLTWTDWLVVDATGQITLINLPGLAGTKTYYVSDSSGGGVTRKLTFLNGLLVSET